MNCLIIAGGEFDTKFASSYVKNKYKDARPGLIIAADKGLEAVKMLGLQPDIMLGDYDSIDSVTYEEFARNPRIENLKFPPEKDYTDSHLAVMTAIERGATDICLLGMTGSRIDHVQANIGLLKSCADRRVHAELVDAHNRIQMVCDAVTIEADSFGAKYVSLIPYSDVVTGIYLRGFKYSLENACFSKNTYEDVEGDMGPSRGISNELLEEKASIEIASGYLLVIESKD